MVDPDPAAGTEGGIIVREGILLRGGLRHGDAAAATATATFAVILEAILVASAAVCFFFVLEKCA